MEVLGLGNVKECNRIWIFLANDTREKANKERLEEIHVKAVENIAFYKRAYKEIQDYYNRKYDEVFKKYKYITEEDVKKAFKENRRKGLELSWDQERNNKECLKAFSRVYGISDLYSEIILKVDEAEKLLKQSENALKSY